MSTNSWFVPGVLEPVRGSLPCGEDFRYSAEWRAIDEAKRADDEFSKGSWEPKDVKVADWRLAGRLTQELLTGKTKDVRLAVVLLEAAVRLEGLEALGPGFECLRELVARYWNEGLHPRPEGENYEDRAAAFDWIDTRLPDLISVFPITARKGGGADYSYGQYLGALRIGRESEYEEGRVSESRRKHFLEAKEGGACLDLYEAAENATPDDYLEGLCALFSDSLESLERLKAELDERICPTAARAKMTEKEVLAKLEHSPGVSGVRNRLREIFEHLDTILKKRRKNQPAAAPGTAAKVEAPAAASEGAFRLNLEPSGQAVSDGSWARAEALVASGEVEKGLAEMARLAQAETCGRARFHRKLILAEVCIQKQRNRLARTILEELNDQITKYKLDEWEATGVAGAVWTRLNRIYHQSGEPEKAAPLYLRLCHLDPWQALGSSED